MKTFNKFFSLASLALSSIILGISLITISQKRTIVLNPERSAWTYIIPGCIIMCFFLWKVYGAIAAMKSPQLVSAILGGGIIFLQIVMVGFVAKIYPITDCFTTLDQAMAMVESQNGLLDNTTEYFARYTNNYFFTICMYYVFLVSKKIGLDYFMTAVVINIFCIDMTIFLSYKVANEIGGERKALMLLFVMLICPTTYLFIYFPYTNTFSAPFIMALILCFIRCNKYDNKKVCYIIAIPFLLIIGSLIRPTTIIVGIAGVISIILQTKTISARFLIKGMLISGIAILLYLSINLFIKNHLLERNNTKGFPATHWIMMGLKGTGEVNGKDVEYTMSFPKKEEKIQGNIKEILERGKRLGVKEICKLYISKIGKEWSIGTDDYQVLQSSDEKYTKLYQFIFGERRAVTVIYTQVFRATTFAYIVFFLICYYKKNEIKDMVILLITFSGIVVFLMIWETNKKHNICFLPVCLVMMIEGISCLREVGLADFFTYRIKHIKKVLLVFIGMIFVIIDFIILIDKDFYTTKKFLFSNYLYYKAENNPAEITKVSEEGKTVEQVFWAPKDFNSFSVHFKRDSIQTNAEYKVSLVERDSEKILVSHKVSVQSLPRDGWIEINLTNKMGKADKFYIIRIVGNGKKDSLKIVSFESLVLKNYKKCKLLINSIYEKGAISFRVMKKEKQVYYPTWVFGMLFGLFVCCQIYIIGKEVFVVNKQHNIGC